MQIVSQIIGTSWASMPVKNPEKAHLRPLGSLRQRLISWFQYVKDDWYAILIVVTDDPLVCICCVWLYFSAFLRARSRRLMIPQNNLFSSLPRHITKKQRLNLNELDIRIRRLFKTILNVLRQRRCRWIFRRIMTFALHHVWAVRQIVELRAIERLMCFWQWLVAPSFSQLMLYLFVLLWLNATVGTVLVVLNNHLLHFYLARRVSHLRLGQLLIFPFTLSVSRCVKTVCCAWFFLSIFVYSITCLRNRIHDRARRYHSILLSGKTHAGVKTARLDRRSAICRFNLAVTGIYHDLLVVRTVDWFEHRRKLNFLTVWFETALS
jgi:hypothetical protein